MKDFKLFHTIGPILQITKDLVNKDENYHEYIQKNNNTLYSKQIPLLLKHSRIAALHLKKQSIIYKDINDQVKTNQINTNYNIYSSSLNIIRKKKYRSRKLPALCPMYNEKGEYISSIIETSKISYRNLIYNNNTRNKTSSLVLKGQDLKNINSFYNIRKLEPKKLTKINIFNVNNLNINTYDNHYNNLNEPEYDNLKYEEKEIFGHKNLYKEIILNKINQLKFEYNKNFTTKKEKNYFYGVSNTKIKLTLESLKITIYEVINEINYEKKDVPSFVYSLPLSLLPLFYYKGADKFLIILSKLIVYNEEREDFDIFTEIVIILG